MSNRLTSHGHCYTAVLASWYVMLRWTETVTANREEFHELVVMKLMRQEDDKTSKCLGPRDSQMSV